MYPDYRDRDPDPIGRGWEAAVAAVLIALVSAALVALAGQGIAAALFGGGWVWPAGTNGQLVRAVAGLLTGRPGRELNHADAARLPGMPTVYASVAASEVALAVLLVTAGIAWSRYRRPRDARRGMATRAEASRVIGIAQMRRARPIVRPDLEERS